MYPCLTFTRYIELTLTSKKREQVLLASYLGMFPSFKHYNIRIHAGSIFVVCIFFYPKP